METITRGRGGSLGGSGAWADRLLLVRRGSSLRHYDLRRFSCSQEYISVAFRLSVTGNALGNAASCHKTGSIARTPSTVMAFGFPRVLALPRSVAIFLRRVKSASRHVDLVLGEPYPSTAGRDDRSFHQTQLRELWRRIGGPR
jgi:hypothetical protein